MFLGKLAVTLSVKKFPVFYGTEVSLHYSKDLGTDPILRHLNNFTSSHIVSLRSIILFYMLWSLRFSIQMLC